MMTQPTHMGASSLCKKILTSSKRHRQVVVSMRLDPKDVILEGRTEKGISRTETKRTADSNDGTDSGGISPLS